MRSAAIALLLTGPASFGCIVINAGDDDDSADGDADVDVDSDSDSGSDSDGNPLTSGRYVGTVIEIETDVCDEAPEVGTSWQWDVTVSGNQVRLDPADESAPEWTLSLDNDGTYGGYFVEEVAGCDGEVCVELTVDLPGFDLYVIRSASVEDGCETSCGTSYDLSVVPAE